MTNIPLTLLFVAWAIGNLAAYGVRIFSDQPQWVRGGELFCTFSQWLLGAVVFIVIAEGWWQESLLTFSASPTPVLSVPIQDHGTKYVSAGDAEIIRLFGKLFYLTALPFLALAIGREGLRHVRGNETQKLSQ